MIHNSHQATLGCSILNPNNFLHTHLNLPTYISKTFVWPQLRRKKKEFVWLGTLTTQLNLQHRSPLPLHFSEKRSAW